MIVCVALHFTGVIIDKFAIWCISHGERDFSVFFIQRALILNQKLAHIFFSKNVILKHPLYHKNTYVAQLIH